VGPGSGFEPVDLREAALARLAEVRAAGDEDPWPGQSLDPRAELVGLARACHARGLDAEAIALCAEARRRRGRRVGDFEAFVRAEVTDVAWRRLLVQVAGGDRARSATLAAAFARRFEGSPRAAWAAAAAELLARMAEEDRAFRPPEEGANPEARARAEVHRMRDLEAFWMNPGGFGLRFGPGSPEGALRDLGYAAVPVLLEALDDPRFTRSLNHGRISRPEEVLRVGRASLLVLDAISGEGLGSPEQARAWWARVAGRDEAEVLDELVREGGEGAPRVVERLIALDPGRAVRAVEELSGAADPWTAARLVEVIARVDHPAVAPLLRRRLASGATRARIAAARALGSWVGGRDEAAAVLLALWRDWHAPDDAVTWLEPADDDALEALVEAVAGLGTPSALRALGDDLAARDVAARALVLTALLPKPSEGGWGIGGGPASGLDLHLEEAAGVEAEALLAAALLDDEESGLSSVRVGDAWLLEPRLCDLAALALARRWPERFAFDPGAAREARDVARLALHDGWRAARGLPARPPAAPVDPARLSVVRSVTVVGEGAPELAAVARALEGRVLQPGDLPALLRRVPAHTPFGRLGLDVTALRRGGEAGIELTVRLIERPPYPPGAQRFWSWAYVVRAGEGRSHVDKGGEDGGGRQVRLDLDPLEEALRDALSVPPAVRLGVRLRLVAEPPG
jgi:hypothetical protein